MNIEHKQQKAGYLNVAMQVNVRHVWLFKFIDVEISTSFHKYLQDRIYGLPQNMPTSMNARKCAS